jgi:outer membrane protein, adhesin transport system
MHREGFKAVLWFITGVALLSAGTLTSHAETLQEAVAQAVRTNPEALEAVNHRLAADEGLKAARGGYLPRLDVNAGIGREHLSDPYSRSLGMNDDTFTRRQAGATLTQMLFDGFAVKSAVAGQRARVESSAYRLAVTADDLALRVVGAYLDVMRRQETILAARENFNAHQVIYHQIKRRSESGVGRGADLVQAQARLALATDTLRAEESSLKDAELQYLQLVGSPPGQMAKPSYPKTDLPYTEASALDTAVRNHPALKAAEADVAAARAQQSTAKAAFYPKFDLELSVTHDNDKVRGLADDQSIMLRVRYNLFQGGSDRARVNEAGFQVRELTETLNRTRRQVEENTAVAFNANVTAQDRLIALTQYAESSAATREAYAKQFSIGQRSLLDLLNAENEYYNARFSHITGQYSVLASAYRVFAGMGQLLGILQVAMPPGATR